MIPPFSVIVGNGQSITCEGACAEVPVILAKQTFCIPCYILSVHGADLALGVQCLQTLGTFLSNYSIPSIQFTHNGQPIMLTGMVSNSPSSSSFSQFFRFLFTDAIHSIHTMTMTTLETPNIKIQNNTPNFTTSNPEISKLLNTYATVFYTPQNLPPHRPQNHHIHLNPNSQPINIKPYRYPQYQKTIMTNMIQEMLNTGIIKPSTSPFSSPVLLVKKKDGSWCFCIDYRALNSITVKDRFPIPTIDELLDELHGATVFSKLDLRSGYHQILVASKDTFKTTFPTIDGHFEFLVMPFGLSNAPITFQSTMNTIFNKFLCKFVLIFFDDILIYIRNWETHLEHLTQVLAILTEHKLFAKYPKFEFGVNNIAYLGHLISANGVAADPEKLKSIQEWPSPTSITHLHGFLGLTGFYRRFVRHYAAIATPLTKLLKKNAFTWSEQSQSAFESLKEAMTHLLVLGIPNFDVPFDVTTDASSTTVGVVLSQNIHPIVFFSQKLYTKMQHVSAYEREMFAITNAVKK